MSCLLHFFLPLFSKDFVLFWASLHFENKTGLTISHSQTYLFLFGIVLLFKVGFQKKKKKVGEWAPYMLKLFIKVLRFLRKLFQRWARTLRAGGAVEFLNEWKKKVCINPCVLNYLFYLWILRWQQARLWSRMKHDPPLTVDIEEIS